MAKVFHFHLHIKVPEIPGNVVTKVQGPTAIQVSWTKAVVEPGNTTYRIKVYEVVFDSNIYVKDMTVNGYDTETVEFSGLEEYWYYMFTVTASTIKGPATSFVTAIVRTNQAPPGLVQNLIVDRPQHSNNYTQMDVKWNIPQLRDRNSEIKEYILKHNISGIMEEETPRTTADTDNLIKSLSVGTEQLYKIEVTAVNTILQVGQTNSIIYYAQPGPPITPTVHPVITDVSKAVSSQRTISVEMNGDWFFYNKDNGAFTDWGVIVCTGYKCDNYGDGTEIKHAFRFGTLNTWKQSEKTGFVEPFRATNSKWIVDRYNAAVGRRKRSSHEVEFMLGEDNDCSKREDTVYCNGPLAPGKSYIMVAFTCTAGGCTESKPYGPVTTQTEPRHPHGEQQFGDQYEDLGMDNTSSYQELGAKDIPNVYDQIGRVHTIDKHYENMLP